MTQVCPQYQPQRGDGMPKLREFVMRKRNRELLELEGADLEKLENNDAL
jgi:hypothetical protein